MGTYDEIAGKLVERFGDVVTNCEFSIAVKDEEDQRTLTRIAAEVQSLS